MPKHNPFKSAHLIEKTIGSSNEISFNVLESKKLKNGSDSAPAPWEISPEAVAKKKKARVRGRLLTILSIVAVVLIGIVFAIWGFAGLFQNYAGSMDKLHSQINDVVKTSDDLVEMRSTLQLLLNNDPNDFGTNVNADNLTNLKDKAEKSKSTLASEKSNLETTLSEIATPADRDGANNAITLADKESSLVDLYETTFSFAYPFILSKENANSAMKDLIDADAKDREASQLLGNANTDDAKKAIDAANESKQLAINAKGLFQNVVDANLQNEELGLDSALLQSYVDYCDYIISSQDATVAVANAYIDRNKEELQAQNDKYNELKTEAADISKNWNQQLPDLINDQFKEKRQGNTDALAQDLKDRDAIYKQVKSYINGK